MSSPTRRTMFVLALLWAVAAPADTAPAVAVVTDLRGRVERRAADDEAWTAVGLDEGLWLEDQVRTGPRSLAELRFVDGTVLALGERTRLRISLALFDPDQAPPEIRVALLAGETDVRTGSAPLVVTAPDGSERRIPPGAAAHIRLVGPPTAPALDGGPPRPGLAADFEPPSLPPDDLAPPLHLPAGAVPGDLDPLRAVPGDAVLPPSAPPLPEPGPTGIGVRVRVRGETP